MRTPNGVYKVTNVAGEYYKKYNSSKPIVELLSEIEEDTSINKLTKLKTNADEFWFMERCNFIDLYMIKEND